MQHFGKVRGEVGSVSQSRRPGSDSTHLRPTRVALLDFTESAVAGGFSKSQSRTQGSPPLNNEYISRNAIAGINPSDDLFTQNVPNCPLCGDRPMEWQSHVRYEACFYHPACVGISAVQPSSDVWHCLQCSIQVTE